jgi:hypothetical protein
VLLMVSDGLCVSATVVAASGNLRCGWRAGKEGIEIFTVGSRPAVRIAVIVCFLPRPADALDALDVRSARPVSVSYCEEPGPAAGVRR